MVWLQTQKRVMEGFREEKKTRKNCALVTKKEKRQTSRGGPRGVCQKGTIFPGFFRNPSLTYECQKYFIIFSFGHEMGHGIGLAHNRSEKYWQVGVFSLLSIIFSISTHCGSSQPMNTLEPDWALDTVPQSGLLEKSSLQAGKASGLKSDSFTIYPDQIWSIL